MASHDPKFLDGFGEAFLPKKGSQNGSLTRKPKRGNLVSHDVVSNDSENIEKPLHTQHARCWVGFHTIWGNTWKRTLLDMWSCHWMSWNRSMTRNGLRPKLLHVRAYTLSWNTLALCINGFFIWIQSMLRPSWKAPPSRSGESPKATLQSLRSDRWEPVGPMLGWKWCAWPCRH